MPERHVLERGERIPPNDTRETTETLRRNRVALVRHGRAAFLTGTEEFFHFEHFGSLQMPQLGRPTIDTRSDERERGAKFCVAIALDDLGGKSRRLESELLGNMLFDAGIEMGVRADRAAQFPDAHALQSLLQALLGPTEFIEHQSELEAKGDRLRVNAVAASDHRRHLITSP